MPQVAQRLNSLLTRSGATPLDSETLQKFETYLTLLQKWNARTNLTAIRDEEGILSRHFLESILCAQKLPGNIVSLLDYGSGAGLPGIPIALIRKDLEITLAESQNKKSAFLREAIRSLNLIAKVHSGRAEALNIRFDCITLRAVDDMARAIGSAIPLLNPNGWLAVLTTSQSESAIQLATQNSNLIWHPSLPTPKTTYRTLLFGQLQS